MKDRIKEIRKDCKLTQQSFGDRLGISKSIVEKYEYGSRDVPDRTVRDICREFNISESWLRYGIEPKYQEPADDLTQLAAELDFSLDERDEKMKEMMAYLLKTWKALDPLKKEVLIEVINQLLNAQKKEKE